LYDVYENATLNFCDVDRNLSLSLINIFLLSALSAKTFSTLSRSKFPPLILKTLSCMHDNNNSLSAFRRWDGGYIGALSTVISFMIFSTVSSLDLTCYLYSPENPH
jgi:hypothetical protein